MLVFALPLSLLAGEFSAAQLAAWRALTPYHAGLLLAFGFGIFSLGNACQLAAIGALASASLVSAFLPLRLVSALALSAALLGSASARRELA